MDWIEWVTQHPQAIQKRHEPVRLEREIAEVEVPRDLAPGLLGISTARCPTHSRSWTALQVAAPGSGGSPLVRIRSGTPTRNHEGPPGGHGG